MFTPVHTSLGALLLYLASSSLLLHNGAVFGISSLLAGCVFSPSAENVPIVAGLVSSLFPVGLFAPSLIPLYSAAPTSFMSFAPTMGIGYCIGWGTKNGRGCTSGHMLCGVSRLSPRSIIATIIFFTTALLAANVADAGENIPPCVTPCYTPVYPSASELTFMICATVFAAVINHFIVPGMFSRSKPSRIAFSYLAGIEFGLGLLMSGMADSNKVLRFFAFLTDTSRFDPSLALIIVFGIGPSLVTNHCTGAAQLSGGAGRPMKPTLAEGWRLPTTRVADIDWRFVAGAVVFGLGWGIWGVCPGPALLRAVVQPVWGLAVMSGYMIANLP